MAEILARLFEFWHQYPSRAMPMACRYEPSCSLYAAQAVRRHGVLWGGALSLWRLLRCAPWGGSGYDPVPASRHEPHA
jgi:putative membrane protein insertion efficiency factor